MKEFRESVVPIYHCPSDYESELVDSGVWSSHGKHEKR